MNNPHPPSSDADWIYIYIHIYIYIYIYISWPTVVEGDPKAPFSNATTLRCWGGALFHFWSVHYNAVYCGGLSTFRSLRVLLSDFVSTNTTHILQARKQMECDNNKYQETSDLIIIITNMIKIIKIQCSFYVRACVCRKYSYGQFNKKWFVRPCVRVYMLRKSTESMCP